MFSLFLFKQPYCKYSKLRYFKSHDGLDVIEFPTNDNLELTCRKMPKSYHTSNVS